ncbi:MAG: SH3 domain-containing protein [Dehalococcoidia bacterium]|nr:SH3 domain-containing protein [Dehalococcoidia bacterium]
MHLLRRPLPYFLLLPLLAAVAIVTGVQTTARADSGYPAGTFGYDISYPQCPSNTPTGSFGFAIIGVNNGRPLTKNPCFAAQMRWAAKGTHAPQVYINSSSPPATFTTAACSATDAACRSYQFGRESARYAMNYVATQSVAVERYWLDVETMNTWSSDKVANAAVLRGMVEVLQGSGKIVGIYSNSYQFGLIAGNYTPGLDTWIPRPEAKRETAAEYCRSTSSFGGGRLVMIQLWYTYDENYVCGAAGAPPPAPGDTLRSGDPAVVNVDDCVNLRPSASISTKPIECLAHGTRVTVTGTPTVGGQYTWVPVRTSAGKTGWVAADYLRKWTAPVAAPAASPTATRTPNRVTIANVAGG